MIPHDPLPFPFPFPFRRTRVLFAAAFLAAAGCASLHQKLSPENVPAPVRAAVAQRFPGAQVTSVEREKEHGRVVYDYELNQDGRKFETDVLEDGTLLEVEKQLAPADVPDAVSRAVAAKYPRAKVREVMEVDKVTAGRETPDHYEVTLAGGMAGGKEVNVSVDGRVTEETAD